jgi:hypothetical protein
MWHFTCQLLSAVAEVTSSVFSSSFRGEHMSPFYFSSQRLNLPASLVSSPLSLSSSGWYSLPIDVQAMLLRNRVSFL